MATDAWQARGGFSVRQIGQLPKVKLNTLSNLLSFFPQRNALLMANMHNCVWCEVRWQSHSVDWWASHTIFEELSRSVTFVFLKCQSFCLILCLYSYISLAVFFNKPLSQALIGLPNSLCALPDLRFVSDPLIGELFNRAFNTSNYWFANIYCDVFCLICRDCFRQICRFTCCALFVRSA